MKRFPILVPLLSVLALAGIVAVTPASAASMAVGPVATHTLRADVAVNGWVLAQPLMIEPYAVQEIGCNTTGDGVCLVPHYFGVEPAFAGAQPLTRGTSRPFLIMVDPDLSNEHYVHYRLWNMVNGQWQHRAYSNSKFQVWFVPGPPSGAAVMGPLPIPPVR